MSEQCTATIQIKLPPSLYRAIKAQAEREAGTISGVSRRVLMRWFQANEVTLEQCRVLVDPGVEYEVTEP